MKKSLIALAALATVGAAQAQSSNVTIYGIMDAGYTAASTTTAGGAKVETTGVNPSNSASGRLGFRGVEDLGGGLRAEFVAEGNLRTTNSSDLTGRQSFVTLRSNTAGALHMGLLHSTNHLARTALDPFGGANMFGNINYNTTNPNGMTGSIYAETGTAGNGTTGANTYVTRGQAIAYELPRFANTTLAISYAPGDNKTTTAGATTHAGSTLPGTTNALSARLVSNVTKELTVIAAYLDGTGKAGTSSEDARNTTLGAIYNMGTVQLFASRTDDKSVGNIGSRNYKKVVNTVGLTATMGKIKYMAHYLDGEHTAADNISRSQNGLKLGAEYILSKRTSAYALYGQQEGQNTARTADNKDKGYAFGMRHSF